MDKKKRTQKLIKISILLSNEQKEHFLRLTDELTGEQLDEMAEKLENETSFLVKQKAPNRILKKIKQILKSAPIKIMKAKEETSKKHDDEIAENLLKQAQNA